MLDKDEGQVRGESERHNKYDQHAHVPEPLAVVKALARGQAAPHDHVPRVGDPRARAGRAYGRVVVAPGNRALGGGEVAVESHGEEAVQGVCLRGRRECKGLNPRF